MMSLAVSNSERRTSNLSRVKIMFLNNETLLHCCLSVRIGPEKPVYSCIFTIYLEAQLAVFLPDIFLSILSSTENARCGDLV